MWDRRGFTLIELIVPLAVVGVIVGSSMIVGARVVGAVRLETAVAQVAADLREARARAVASAAQVRLVLRVGAGTYVRETDVDGTFASDATRRLPAGVSVAAVGSGGTLTFSPTGTAENATVALASGPDRRRSLVLNQRGRVTIVGR